MSSVLVSGITDVFKSQVAGPFASNAGESESSVIRGFETSLKVMVESLGAKVRQGGFTSQLFDLVNSPANDVRVLENPRSLVGGSPVSLGSKFTSLLFGRNVSAVTEEIGSATGVGGRTAASLMTLGAPLLLGTLRKRAGDGRMDNSALSGFLANEADSVRGSLPERVENLIGSDTALPGTERPLTTAVVQERSRSWLWPLLLALLVLAGFLSWLISSQRRAGQTGAPATTQEVNNLITRTLPGNVHLQIPPNQIEDQLLSFIQDPSRPVDQTSWFNFDRLLFDTNSATLQPGSTEELANISAILKAYPNVHVKIGGFSDTTGDANSNMVLSQHRADTVREQLIGMGISGDRIEAQGYADQYPVANNGTASGRQQNRHAALLVVQK